MKHLYQPVVTTRPVTLGRVPDGTPVELPSGTSAQIAQALGSSFTLLVQGQMLRLKGVDADAIGLPPPEAFEVPAGSTADDVDGLVWRALRTCYDPEIPVDIVELGLVYGCDVLPMEDGRRRRVAVRMTLTAPGCGMGEVIAEEVCDKVLALPHVGEATVELVFDPPWDRSRMSEAAQLALGL
jgi:probable FeS assembly SUF system protein SufT